MRPLTPPDCLVVCAGRRVDSRCAEAMDRVTNLLPYLSIRFVDSSWLSARELTATALYWVVDIEFPMDGLQEGLLSALPLLLPAERGNLKALCNDSHSISTYRTAGEAAENIVRIVGTGVNGRRMAATKTLANGAATKHATAGDR